MTGTDAEFETLLRDALGRPEVKEIMEICDQYEELVHQINDYRKAFAPRLAVWTSDRTDWCEGKVEIRAPV